MSKRSVRTPQVFDQLGNFAQGFEHALPSDGDGLGNGFALHLEVFGKRWNGENPRQIAFIELPGAPVFLPFGRLGR